MKKIFVFVLLLSFSGLAQVSVSLQPSRYLSIDGLNIAAYESSGTKSPTVFLIHGNTSSANSFARILRSDFAKKHRVVAVDMAGYGRSDNASSYDVATFTSVISKAATLLKADSGVIVGWSLGGDLALQTASLLPQAKGYFLFGTAPVGGGPLVPSAFLTPAESYAGAATMYGFIPVLTPLQIDQYVTAFFRPQWSSIPSFFYQDGYRTDPGTRQAVLVAASGLDPNFKPEVPVIQSLQVPVALVHAENDAFVRLDYLQAIAPGIPQLWRGEVQVVPKSGHALQWEDPDTFISLLKDFMSELP